MRWKNAPDGYGLPSVALHWLMLVLIAVAYVTMELKSVFPKGSAGREAMAAWHYLMGLSVFALVWLRLLTRLTGITPKTDPPLPLWQSRLARAMHGALYVLMIVLPVLGWLAVSAKGVPVSLFGVELPALIGPSKPTEKALKEVHEFLATAGYALIALHAAAALVHHYVMRDNTLRLMSFSRL